MAGFTQVLDLVDGIPYHIRELCYFTHFDGIAQERVNIWSHAADVHGSLVLDEKVIQLERKLEMMRETRRGLNRLQENLMLGPCVRATKT